MFVALASAEVRAQAADPFAPGLRWRHAASAAVPWMPASVDFAAGGEVAWTSAYGANPRAMALATSASTSTDLAPAREDAGFGSASGAVQVRAARAARALFSIAQYATTDLSHRRTEIARYEAPASPFAPQWRQSLGLIGNGACRLAAARDGSRVVAAAQDNASSSLEVAWLDGASGVALGGAMLSSSTLRELSASTDVQRAALVAGSHVWLLDASGATLYEQDLGAATNALALSGDGRTLAFGLGAHVRTLRENAGTWTFAQDFVAPLNELPIRLALSDDGATLAIAWWNQISGTAARFQVRRNGALAFEHFESTPGSYQNYPTAAQLTPDGERALFASWGDPSTAPELWLADVAAGGLVGSFDLPGSALAAALDDSGTRIAVGVKHAHANQLASTGEFRLYDTGERDLQIVGAPSLASGLHLATRMPGATRAFFVLGQRLATPIPFPGSTGELAILRSQGGKTFVRPTDATGRADLTRPLPFGPLGIDFAAQAVFRVSGALHFTSSVVAPVVF
jgi:hypothetical protein